MPETLGVANVDTDQLTSVLHSVPSPPLGPQMDISKTTKLKISDPEIADVPDQRLQFLEHYIELGDAHQAWIAAGYSSTSKARAMLTIRDNWRIVEKLIRNRIGTHVPMALNGLIQLAQNAKQESVRLKALQDILSRAGYDSVLQIEHSEKDAQSMNNAELDQELQRLLKRSNDEADTSTNSKELH